MSRLVRWLDEHAYPRHGDNWDSSMFRELVLARFPGTRDVLDLGAGAGIVSQMNLRGLGPRVVGVDLDPRVVDNPYLDEGRVASAEAIPFPDASFDLVFSVSVVEHLADPVKAFRDVLRVLRPGGRFLIKTTNKTHYVALIASITPHAFHERVAARRGRAHADTFPTLYKCNTARAMTRCAHEAGFEIAEIRRVEGRPEYLRISGPAYLAGTIYERIVNATELLAPLRAVLFADLRKPAL